MKRCYNYDNAIDYGDDNYHGELKNVPVEKRMERRTQHARTLFFSHSRTPLMATLLSFKKFQGIHTKKYNEGTIRTHQFPDSSTREKPT